MLVHSSDRIIPELSRELGDYARAKLERRGIDFVLGQRVAAADADSVTLDDDSRLSTRTLVWTAGNQPSPLLRGMPCERNRRGQLVVEPTLQVPGLDGVWALGDGAQVPDVHRPGAFHPPTAQHAIRQGKTVADNVVAVARGQAPKPFSYRAIGSLVALGSRTAAAEVAGRKFSGFVAWVMWRTIYFTKLPGMDRKVRVALDWAIDLLFPRDIVLLPGPSDTVEPRGGSGEQGSRRPPEPVAPIEFRPMIRSDRLTAWLLTGALAGLVGGAVLALAMLNLGMMASMALIVTARESLGVGLLVHFVLSAVFGVLFAALVRNQARRNDALVFWGLAYGAVVWFLDPLTLYPLTAGRIGHLVAGRRAVVVQLAARIPALRRDDGPGAAHPQPTGRAPALAHGDRSRGCRGPRLGRPSRPVC